MSLPLILSVVTLALGFLPTAGVWRARARTTPDWITMLTTSGGLVWFAYNAGPWLFVSYYLRYVALAAYGVVAFASFWRRSRMVLPVPVDLRWSGLTLRVAAVIIVLALNVWVLGAGVAPPLPLDIAFPLGHGTYSVLQGGNSLITNPFHRTSASERLALDLVRINAWGARANGLAPRALAQYAVFGDSVISPCDGTVGEASNDVADNPPRRANVTVPAGNHIILRCGDTDLLLAHLQLGSVMVRRAQAVTRGQLLGRVGNSGNTSEPHLHISASRGGLAVPLTFGGRFLTLNSLFTAPATASGSSP